MAEEQGYAVPMTLPSERADLFDKLQPGIVIEEIRHRLLGEAKIGGKWVKLSYMKDRALTEVGAWDISTLMFPASSQNVSISKLNANQIKNRLLNIDKTAQKMCLRNHKEYGIKGVDQLWFVHEIVFTNTMATLNQPEGEGIRKMLGTMGSADFSAPEPEPAGLQVFRK